MDNISGKRISILERAGPAAAFILTAASGIVGAMELRHTFESIQAAADLGQKVLFSEAARVETRVGTVLAAASVIGLLSAAFSLTRVFTKNMKPTPPAWMIIPPSVIALLSPLAIAAALWTTVSSAAVQGIEGAASAGITVGNLCVAAIGIAIFSFLVTGTFLLAPFKSKPGPKLSPFIFILIFEFVLIAVAAAYFWAAYISITAVNSGFLN